jgi:hypothetical protein
MIRSRKDGCRFFAVVVGVVAGTAVFAGVATAQTGQSPDYGTAHLSYIQVAGVSFIPADSNAIYGMSNVNSGQVLRTSGGAFVYFTAPIQIPSGAILKSLALDECDNTTSTGYVQGSIVESDRLGNVIATLPSFILSDGTGCKSISQDLTSLNMVSDNTMNHFWLVANISVAGGFNVGLAGMVVGYQLQVSPAPGTATFGDVPTSHPFFQFIEALAASGVTGGCGGGNYCPNNPVTRGQMAVFLAKALGLQFP